MSFDFGPIADAYIARFSVGFAYVRSGIPKALGSGTLVKCSGIQGILTCGHVLQEIETHDEIRFVLFPVMKTNRQETKMNVSMIAASAIKFYEEPLTQYGPDLAFIPLPEVTMADLAASASVLDLDRGKAKATSPTPKIAKAFEVVAGVVGEMTPPAQIENGVAALRVEGLMNVGKVISESQSEGFDLLTFRPRPEAGFKLPSTYRGTSGGGIWRVRVQEQEDGTYEALETWLTGVAFWQTPDRDIIGHGPISIYENLLNEIYKRWPRH